MVGLFAASYPAPTYLRAKGRRSMVIMYYDHRGKLLIMNCSIRPGLTIYTL